MSGQAENADCARIIHVDATRRKAATEMLLNKGTAAVTRFLTYAQENEVSLDYFWSCEDQQGLLTASVLAVPHPGRTAMMFATHPSSSADVDRIGRLIDHACTQLGEEGIHLVQALLDVNETTSQETYRAGGFFELGTLSYMQRRLSPNAKHEEPDWPEGVTVQTYTDSHRDDLITILDASYEETLDCPGLTGLRNTSDILEGHLSTHEFDPELWTLFYVDGCPSGALLLNPAPAQNTVELVYIGLAKAARGRGLSRLLLRNGYLKLAGRKEHTITLAVDEQNSPALNLYKKEGFTRVFRRVAFVRSLRNLPAENE